MPLFGEFRALIRVQRNTFCCLLPGLDARCLRLFPAHLLPEGDRRGLPRRRQAGRRGHLLDAGHAPRRRTPVRRDGGTIRPPPHPDAQRRRLLRLRTGLRLRAHAAQLSGLPRSLRHRHGRRLGRRRRARPGDAARAGSRLLLRPAAGGLRLSATCWPPRYSACSFPTCTAPA